eukprot:GHVL01015089.1.p1 GENE.GHVL01015089.1~~GHVL01015089.1.p1  ORF type:complete len:288 (+),score=63.91 GHVL01015089.1:291-1154(+)
MDKSAITEEKRFLPETLEVSGLQCLEKEKENYLAYILIKQFQDNQSGSKILIFVNSITYVLRLHALLNILMCQSLTRSRNISKNNIFVGGLHSRLRQKDRLKKMEQFQKAPRGVLICTDVAARGLHLPKVDLVVHVQPPRTTSNFVHRSGRTARMNEKGMSICIMTTESIPAWKQILRHLAKELKIENVIDHMPKPPHIKDKTSKKFENVRQLYMMAEQVDKLSRTDRKDANDKWLQKAAEMADIELEDPVDNNIKENELAKQKKLKQVKRLFGKLSEVYMYIYIYI